MMANKVIVQFKTDASSDLDRLFHVEETLFQAFSQCNDGFVDGHDIGQGKFNIFIHVQSSWASVLERVEAFLKLRGVLEEAVIVKFQGKTERYQVVRPATYDGEFAL
ncbi:hypothetical protein B0E51_14400 [Rhodanobacter sp. C05]|nr:hypothetical protein B0E51_17745 [Rhodanobacter sp. C05]OOG38363.1 hypothetical protein B0E51_14400 [Rhodanobacter sp. C05]